MFCFLGRGVAVLGLEREYITGPYILECYLFLGRYIADFMIPNKLLFIKTKT